MDLPVMPPVSPMLAKATEQLPEGDSYVFEPKWDGFRCIVFRDGDEVELGSRNERPLTRYFPELVEAIKATLPARCVLDGEIVIATDDGLDFDALQQRIHPAASRINMLANKTPASFVAFDALALGDRDLRATPFGQRRMAMQEALANVTAPIFLTPLTSDRQEAERWFQEFEGAGFDGVVAKSTDLHYEPNKRVMLKVKHKRTADCVVAGFRWHKTGGVVGSLLLGLYDDDGVLHHVGITSTFTASRRRELLEELSAYRVHDLAGHPWQSWTDAEPDGQRKPGARSRWNAKKDLSFEPLRADRVVEVAYDQLQGDRFRHGTTFLRWRDDRSADSCTYSQLDLVAPMELKKVFSA